MKIDQQNPNQATLVTKTVRRICAVFKNWLTVRKIYKPTNSHIHVFVALYLNNKEGHKTYDEPRSSNVSLFWPSWFIKTARSLSSLLYIRGG